MFMSLKELLTHIFETLLLSSWKKRIPYYLMSSLLKYFIFAILTLRLMTLVVSWSTRFIYISWCNSMPKVLWPDFPQITHNWYLTNRQHVEYHKSHNIDIKQIWPQSKVFSDMWDKYYNTAAWCFQLLYLRIFSFFYNKMFLCCKGK